MPRRTAYGAAAAKLGKKEEVAKHIITPEELLLRFLILGTEGGTLYVSEHSEQKLTIANAVNAVTMLQDKASAFALVDIVHAVSVEGRAPKQGPTLFALALATDERTSPHAEVRSKAFGVIPAICRTPTMLFQYLELRKELNPGDKTAFGRGLRKAVAAVYNKPTTQLALHVTKYRQREGWTHNDVLRLAHVKPDSAERDMVFHYAAKGELKDMPADATPEHVVLRERLERIHTLIHMSPEDIGDGASVAALIAKDRMIAREHLPSASLKMLPVIHALLPQMPLMALLRNVSNFHKAGAIRPLSKQEDQIVAKFANKEALRKSRLHPLKILVALRMCKQNGVSQRILDALDQAYYDAFANVEPTNKRYLLAFDVSGSMTSPAEAYGYGRGHGVVKPLCGCPGLAPRTLSAALGMVTLRTEPKCHTMAFSRGFIPLALSPRDSLEGTIKKMGGLPFDSTNCSMPMEWALKNKIEVDVFVIYTDNDTNCQSQPPAQALRTYREKMGIDAKLVVIGMTATQFSIADPSDPGMLDVVGMDTSVPQLMADFVNGYPAPKLPDPEPAAAAAPEKGGDDWEVL